MTKISYPIFAHPIDSCASSNEPKLHAWIDFYLPTPMMRRRISRKSEKEIHMPLGYSTLCSDDSARMLLGVQNSSYSTCLWASLAKSASTTGSSQRQNYSMCTSFLLNFNHVNVVNEGKCTNPTTSQQHNSPGLNGSTIHQTSYGLHNTKPSSPMLTS